MRISKTYRNCQELIDTSGKFIMKNKSQIAKSLLSNKTLSQPIQFVFYSPGEEYLVLKELLVKIYKQNKNHKVLILARTNKAIERMFWERELIDGMDSKVEFVGYEDLDIDGMTIHKSKGLTSDEVILIGLDGSFPSEKSDYWLSALFKQKPIAEAIPFAEERRLFYVALTRTKNYVYLLVNSDKRFRSSFVNEIFELIQEKK